MDRRIVTTACTCYSSSGQETEKYAPGWCYNPVSIGRNKIRELLFLLFLCFPLGAVAQSTNGSPDLSGTWKLNIGKSKHIRLRSATKEEIIAHPPVYEIQQSGDFLELTLRWGGQISTAKYNVDGKAYLTSTPESRAWMRAYWSKRGFTIEEEHFAIPKNPKWIRRITLSDDSQMLIARTSIDLYGIEEMLVFDKQ